MIAIAAVTSVGIHSIMLSSEHTTLPPASSIPLGEINKFMKTHAVNLSEKIIRQADTMAHEAMVADMILSDGCKWKAALIWGDIFGIFGNMNCEYITQNISQTNYE